MEIGLKSVNQAMKITGSSRLDEEKPRLGSEATAPREEPVLPLPELIACISRRTKASLLSKDCYGQPWGMVPMPACKRAWHLHKLQGIVSLRVSQLSIFTQAQSWTFTNVSQDPKPPLVPCRYFALCSWMPKEQERRESGSLGALVGLGNFESQYSVFNQG